MHGTKLARICVYMDLQGLSLIIKISMHAVSQEHHLELPVTWKTAFDANCRPKQVTC